MMNYMDKIKQRRLQILVHSYIYYELNQNIVTDAKWSQWAKELVDLQIKYPKESKQVDYYEQFIDFDGSTGAFFNYDDFIISKANQLLKLKQKSTKENFISQKKVISKKSNRKRLF